VREINKDNNNPVARGIVTAAFVHLKIIEINCRRTGRWPMALRDSNQAAGGASALGHRNLAELALVIPRTRKGQASYEQPLLFHQFDDHAVPRADEDDHIFDDKELV
jgi:hypothetical protein